MEICSGESLYWSNDFSVTDFFRKKYGEPLECLEIKNGLVTVLTRLNKKETFSETYFVTSPN